MFGRKKLQPDRTSFDGIHWGTSLDNLNFSQSIIFTNKEYIVAREVDRIPFVEETIEFIDEEECVIAFPVEGSKDHSARPMTAISGHI
jgi:hypothetical protein